MREKKLCTVPKKNDIAKKAHKMLSAIAAPDADSLTCRNGFRRQPGCLGSTVDLHRRQKKLTTPNSGSGAIPQVCPVLNSLAKPAFHY